MIRIGRETHETPENIQRILAVAGGLNPFSEPNYRFVWGWNRLGWIGGKWEDRDETGAVVREVIGVRLEPKYVPCDRWHVERWCPAEKYGSPAMWDFQTRETYDGRSVQALGPYPSRGEYELVFTLEDPRGKFVQLTPEIARRVAQMVERSRAADSGQRKAAVMRQAERADRDYDNFADEVLSDTNAFSGQPFVAVH